MGVVEDEEGCFGDFGGFWGLGGDGGFEEEGEDGGDRGVDGIAGEYNDWLRHQDLISMQPSFVDTEWSYKRHNLN